MLQDAMAVDAVRKRGYIAGRSERFRTVKWQAAEAVLAIFGFANWRTVRPWGSAVNLADGY